MGANAQTTVPTFTVGQVLTADQQNQSARTGVPVFASSVERDAAFGGSGEKTLAEGQLAYLEDSDIVQYYDGSGWATVGPSADSGLTLVSATTIGTTVSSVTVSGAFSATYDNYRIVLSGGVGSTGANLDMTLGATVTGYAYNTIFMAYNASTVTGQNSNNASSFIRVGRGTTNTLDGEIELKNPFATKRTTAQWRISGAASNDLWSVGGGYLDDATSYADFTFTTSAGTVTGGTIFVYGYKN